MKKILLVFLSLLLIVSLFACGPTETSVGGSSEEPVNSSSEPAATEPPESTDTQTPGSTPGGTPGSTLPEDGEKVVTDDYVALKNAEAWQTTPGDAVHEYSGTGVDIFNAIYKKYSGYTREYYKISDGESTKITESEARKLDLCGADVEADDAAKTVKISIYPVTLKIWTEFTQLEAKAGSYIMFSFKTNVNATYAVTVSPKSGSSAQAAYLQNGISVSGGNGSYTGTAKFTVPYKSGTTMYVNICTSGGTDSPYETATGIDANKYPVYVSIPVTITPAKYESKYSLMFQGDWELVRDKEYLPNLIDLFYNTYPRLYARFAEGWEPRQITFVADKTYDGVAYCQGTRVVVATDYANSHPDDLGFFSHEITHSVQQYSKLNYGDDAWWTENMANYGGFRYFHWGYSTKFVQIYSMSDRTLQDWGYQPYGNNKVFFAYMDYKYPTKVDADGNKTLGLIDSLNHLIKSSKVMLNDNPKTKGSPFNNCVKEVTGLDTMEDVRLQFVKELQEGTWAFVGFRDYTDNFLTENIEGVPNPTYPMLEKVQHGDKTNPLSDTVVKEGDNLALNATVVEYSNETKASEAIKNAFDGDPDTKWCSTKASSTARDHKYELAGYQHGFIIDLGEVKTFNTYTMLHAGIKESASFNAKTWEVLISSDGEHWTSIDYQENVARTHNELSVNVGEQSARYVQVRYFAADWNGAGTVRLYEFMLFEH